jgi:hypothetical protein
MALVVAEEEVEEKGLASFRGMVQPEERGPEGGKKKRASTREAEVCKLTAAKGQLACRRRRRRCSVSDGVVV